MAKNEMVKRLKKAHDLFNERYDRLYKEKGPEGIFFEKSELLGYRGGYYLGWNDILNLTKHAFGVTRLEHIEDSKIDEADEFAYKLVELYFEKAES